MTVRTDDNETVATLSRDADHVATWPLGADDLETAAGWLADERNARWLDFGAGTPAMNTVALKLMSERDEHCIWVFGPAEDRTPIGLVALGNIQPRFRTAEAWCVLGEKSYGPRDLTIHAVDRLIRHAFDELDIHCIYAWTVEINRGGRRILERAGFQHGGRLRASHRIDDRVYDRLWFDLLSHEYHGCSETWK